MMIAELEPYHGTVLAWLLLAGLFLLQLLVADIAGLRARQVPGTPVTADHGDFLFRAVRAHANTNESIAAFVLLTLAAVCLQADPAWVNGLALAFVGCRALHMLCYWLDLRLARSVAFGGSLVALLGLLGTGLRAL